MAAPLWDYLRVSVVGLLALVGLGLAVLYAARREAAARMPGAVEVLARLPLETRRAVYVIRVLDQVLILAASEAGIEKLAELPASAAADLRPPPPPSIWPPLARLGRHRASGAAPENKP